jgi:hypothetical protein
MTKTSARTVLLHAKRKMMAATKKPLTGYKEVILFYSSDDSETDRRFR